ncbi:D-tyrosyl-tRNA(Tyr) deacylase [Clostridium tyrobutyricum]|mgnify:CR=1 FL=1|jgi:D-tyrosyl-tRNA(Tyr) deacylase|uniref:D-aminoacyl-tRNA deacylase n=3 Tax=Clostridium tyrobutyricum TaxID=1519 RepID=W6N3P7_CLOTY|nr:D-aminoacyl-tRNA deacylase [Clostridium tyrobutyricum]AND84170.1 D-aminoacyl-tRNA deacylase [Clostridium tyrobutyricum]ANP68896.1 D-tyrosyl-tRNA(Tyr) deacylase [Clostridium tyrobutyricum]MBV4431605.1 D-tyrosyl-tRNA(Tyr) deacylase [Clostridium tyrobutyricum]MBV4434498.1 D-tyrosyl-tRNA(Tyr) deacylase [Clostridium tyrobutyricum]MBV4437459.1 D-tyrosyl-tRNA(Tyr) deacylase [Clostridium tyrobutyricum]
MRAVVQRVKNSKVQVDGNIIGQIDAGLNVLLGISKEDNVSDIEYLKDKIINLRIFEDDHGKLNKSLMDVGGELLLISQFTLYGDCRKGRRPSFVEALSGDKSEKLYNEFVKQCKSTVKKVETGKFGADMLVTIENDGPVTILLDSKKNF